MQTLEAFREHIKTITQQEYVFDRLNRLLNRNEQSLFAFIQSCPSDELIEAFISDSFGIWGGGSMEQPKGWYEYKGGKHPQLLITDPSHAERDKLQGSCLIAAFRILYDV